jgi:hypothetical protein
LNALFYYGKAKKVGEVKALDYFFLKSREHELMQNLLPVFVGPSLNKCPKCPLHFLQITSVLIIRWEKSFFNSTLSMLALSKLGHPVPESNFASEENNSAPQPAQV